MHVNYFTTLIIPGFLAISLLIPNYARSEHITYIHNTPELCRGNVEKAVEQFVYREFPEQLQSFRTTLPLGILCHESRPLAKLAMEFQRGIMELRDDENSVLLRQEARQNFEKRFKKIAKNHDDMADVLIIVMLTTGKRLYYQIHIHFSHEGILEETGMATHAKWMSFNDDSEWQEEWCEFVQSVYPEELKEQGCLP